MASAEYSSGYNAALADVLTAIKDAEKGPTDIVIRDFAGVLRKQISGLKALTETPVQVQAPSVHINFEKPVPNSSNKNPNSTNPDFRKKK